MSSTGRGAVREPEDYYTTPSWCVRRLLDVWSPPCWGHWVEPSAGNGAIIRAVNAVRTDVEWLAMELREEEADTLRPIAETAIGNFLTEDPFHDQMESVNVVIGNPPYEHAEAFVHRARYLFPNAEVVMLLRLAFLASKERATFMREVAPDVFVLPDRPSFTGEGGDSADYAWLRWHPYRREHEKLVVRQEGTVRVLAVTPLAERQADRGHAVMIEPAQRGLFFDPALRSTP